MHPGRRWAVFGKHSAEKASEGEPASSNTQDTNRGFAIRKGAIKPMIVVILCIILQSERPLSKRSVATR